jgi:hypothetical protein
MLPGREERAQLAAALSSRPVMLLTASAVLGSAAIAAAALRAATGSYTPVFLAIAVCSLTAALLLLAAGRGRRQAVGN